LKSAVATGGSNGHFFRGYRKPVINSFSW
jgi:hypothetical protein